MDLITFICLVLGVIFTFIAFKLRNIPPYVEPNNVFEAQKQLKAFKAGRTKRMILLGATIVLVIFSLFRLILRLCGY